MLLRTLGVFDLVAGNLPAGSTVPESPLLGPAKPLALLTYLALAPGRRAERDTLIDALWGAADPERARGTLRQTVWALRQKFGEGAVRTDREALVLDLPLTVDAQQFEQAVEAADWRHAWTLYAGPFLKDINLAGATGFMHWADRQRARYEVLHLTAGENLARQQLREQHAVDACVTLRTLVELAPDRWDLWTLLFETRLASGDRVGARLDAEQLRAIVAQEELRPPAAVRTLLDRLRRAPTASQSTAQDTDHDDAPAEHRSALRPSRIGREQALATLFERWQAVSAGEGGALHAIRGSAGMGKSRLLREFRERLEDLGSTVIARRPRPADRDMPYAFAASLAEALAELPGAAGVSPATASVLVDLAPTLSNTFPYAGRSTSDPDELLRRRTLALAELLQLVTDEAPLALLLDDLHWMDSSSRQLLASLSERLTDTARTEFKSASRNDRAPNGARISARGASSTPIAVLLVVCYRPVRGGWVLPPEASATELGPLVDAQIAALLQSLGAEPLDTVHALSRILFEAAGGVPLLTLSALDLALERGWLQLAEGRWQCDDWDALQNELTRGGVLERLLNELPADSLSVLLALALLRRPLDTAQLAAVVHATDVEGLLRSLERRGLLVQSGSQWDTAHDRYADAADSIASPELKRTVAVRLSQVLTKAPDPEPRLLQLAGRLLHAVNEPGVRRFFLRWLHAANRRRYWREPLTAAATFLGRSASVPEAQTLSESVPWYLRYRHGYPEVAFIAVLGSLSLVSLAGFAVIRPYLEPRATQMVLAPIPTERDFLWDDRVLEEGAHSSWPEARYALPIAISFRDDNRALTRNTPSKVRFDLVDVSGSVRLSSDSASSVVRGDIDEDSLVLTGIGRFKLRVRAEGLPDVVTPTIYATRRYRTVEELLSVGPSVHVLSGTLNGVSVDSANRIVTVSPGAEISGEITVRAITDTRDASILMGAVALWGDRRENFIVLDALPAFGVHLETFPFEDRLSERRLRVPRQPGRYQIVIVWGTETEMRYLASATNWVLGAPRWNDGNDIADLTPQQLMEIERDGSVDWMFLKPAGGRRSGRVDFMPSRLPGTVITFVVQ